MKYDAVLFDNDGVLLTLNRDVEVFRRMVRETFAEFGVRDPGEVEVEAFMGALNIQEMQGICRSYDLELEEFWRSREMRSYRIQRGMIREGDRRLYDDVDALQQLDGAGLGVVSNNQHRTVEHVVNHYDIDVIDSYYGREPSLDGIRRMKPEPYYLERVLDDLSTRDAVFVGDRESDVLAAEAAGIDSVFLERPHARAPDRGPTYRASDLHELVELVTR